MKNFIFALILSFTVITMAHAFSEEVLHIIHKHWTIEDKMFIELDPSVCENMTDGICRLLDQLFEEAESLGRQISLVGPCRPYPVVGNVAYHRGD